MQTTATITAIGATALASDDPLVILFDESATDALRDVAVIQRFDDAQAQAALTVQAGDQLKIDSQSYRILRVGSLANSNLQHIGHVSLYFRELPDTPMENALYLEPYQKPSVQVGSVLTYITA